MVHVDQSYVLVILLDFESWFSLFCLRLAALCAASEDVFQGNMGLGLILLLGSDCTVAALFCCPVMRLMMLFDMELWVSPFLRSSLSPCVQPSEDMI